MGVFEEYPRGSWKPKGGREIFFPVQNVKENGGNRLAARERLYRPGAKQDSTGEQADSWIVVIHPFNGLNEPGLDPNQYPDLANDLIKACKSQECGDLTLPTRGTVRARAHTWTRDEDANRRDSAVLQITWVADNEDDQTALTFSPPNARSAARAQAFVLVEELQKNGAWNDVIADLMQLAGELEAAAMAPGDFKEALLEKAEAMQHACASISASFGAVERLFDNPTAGVLLEPDAYLASIGLFELAEMAANARRDVEPAQPVSITYARTVSILDVAADTGQDLDDLTGLNPNLGGDLLAIPAGTPILIRPQAA